MGASTYILGQSTHEQERLTLQARVLRPYTEKYFRTAGIAPGMRVLDLGSGVGDVAILAGDIVGPGGCVVGLDRDPISLERARQRTVEQGCSSWVSFQATTLEDFATSERFDAMVGRFILLYQPDAAATLRRMNSFLKPGGIVVFHEIDFSMVDSNFPVCELWDQVVSLAVETFRRSGLRPDFGRRLARTYLDAGLPFPSIVSDTLVGGERGSYLFPWIANTVVSVAPRFADLGLSLPPGVVADYTLAAKLEEAVVALGCQLIGPAHFGAWSRTPSR